MNAFEKAIKIYKGLVGTDCFEKALEQLDRDIELCGVWNIAHQMHLLSEDRDCEEFSIAHMTAYNKTFGLKY